LKAGERENEDLKALLHALIVDDFHTR